MRIRAARSRRSASHGETVAIAMEAKLGVRGQGRGGGRLNYRGHLEHMTSRTSAARTPSSSVAATIYPVVAGTRGVACSLRLRLSRDPQAR
jgi:hypothetical protein